MENLKEKTIRGGVARLLAQMANFSLRLGSLMILARLLAPKDFGLVGMVTAFTGVLTLFRDFGLSSAAIQRADVTDKQLSTLFWINVVVGLLLGLVTVAAAPAIAAFYHESRLLAVTAALALGFLFNGAGVQHSVILQRQMRFTAIAVINTVGLLVGTAIGIGGARAGYGYWALVMMTITTPLISTAGFWLATAWIPGLPRRQVGIRSMIRFGSIVTLNSLVSYIACNLDKVLLGRFWGVDALGIYGRAYQLINIPTDNLNSAAGEVAFSGLSRIQHDRERIKSYFLKGYSVLLALTLPITVACALFADDVIFVVLGPKWGAAAAIFRFLAPTMLVFALVNPLFWLLCALGLVSRSLKIGLTLTPLMIGSYVVGLRYGPLGVAFAYSAVMIICLLPIIAWSVHGTVISVRDLLLAAGRPFASSILAGGFALVVRLIYVQSLSPLPRLLLETSVLIVAFVGMLLFVTGQKAMYLDLFRGLKGPLPVKEKEGLA